MTFPLPDDVQAKVDAGQVDTRHPDDIDIRRCSGCGQWDVYEMATSPGVWVCETCGQSCEPQEPLPLEMNEPAIGKWQADHPDTARAAAIVVYPKTGTQRARLLDAYKASGERGLTDDEAADAAGAPRARTRRQELIEEHHLPIVDSGKRRPAEGGHPAIVWVYRP